MSDRRCARVDRRAIRTRNNLARAVIRLGQERGVDRLTVGELSRVAGVSRSAFYAHYGSLEDYLSRSFAAMLENLAANAQHRAGRDDRRLLQCELILDHVAAAPKYVAVISRSRHRPRMLLAGEERLRRHVEARLLEQRPHLANAARCDIARFVSGGFIAMLRHWMESGMATPPEVFRSRFESLIDRFELSFDRRPGVQLPVPDAAVRHSLAWGETP
jgi:AcrR family transcriptional regulator